MRGVFSGKETKKSLDCFGVKRLSGLLFWSGFLPALLSGCLWQRSGDARLAIGCAAGFVPVLAALAVGWTGIVSPRCGAPLYDFPRLPSHIPSYCPHCGGATTREADDSN